MRPLEAGDRDADETYYGPRVGIGLNDDGTAKSFIDFWDCDIVDDFQADFATAVESARWLDPREGRIGTLANKDTGAVVLIGHRRMGCDEALALAKRLIEEGDARFDDPLGPAGAIPVAFDHPMTGGGSAIGWCFFGWSPYRRWPIEP